MDIKKVSDFLAITVWVVGWLLLIPMLANAAPDPNFHIYIAYGQSNMEGNATNFTDEDRAEHPRVKMFATTSCPNLGRSTIGEMYPAIPPMFKCNSGLSVADWFGRDMADSLPGVTIGIIPVAQAGTSIRLFDPDDFSNYLNSIGPNDQWLVNGAKAYGNDGNAMARIIEVAKTAQEKGVIKGIIFHQGETDGGMNNWEQVVKKTYEYILNQLNLKAEDPPLVAGEMLDGGACSGFSSRVRGLSNYIANFGVASSQGLPGRDDRLHFTLEGYRGMGERYAQAMLKLVNVTPVDPVDQKPFKSAAAELPGKIEAENFDVPGIGSGNDSYNDKDSQNRGDSDYRKDDASSADLYDKATGVILGYNQEGEWFEYSVNIKEAGDYTMFASVATDNSTSGFSLSIDGGTIAEVPTSGTSFDSFDFVKANVTLPEGEHILRMTVTGSWFDVDYFTFVKGKDATDPNAYKTQNPESFNALKPVSNTETTFYLFDLQGKQVARFNIRGMDSAIHMVQEGMGNLRQGVYLLRHKGPAGIQQNIVYKK